jgi:hypothetical protein
MSRNFEVLEQLQQDQELFCVPVTKAGPSSSRPTNGNVSLPDLDAFTREEVLRLVQRLFLATDGKGRNGPRRVVFCGIDETEGSNLLCARVSRSLASQVESHVCVVDANVRVPTSQLFEVEQADSAAVSQSGITNKLLQQIAGNLWLVSGHSVAPSGATPSLHQVRAWIQSLGEEFSYVLISAPPIGLYSDAALLGQWADGVVLVLEANSTRRVAARKAKQALDAANVHVLGTVLNNRTFPIPEKVYRLL